MAVDRKQQMKEITERLEQGVKDIFTSEMYTTYLRTMAKFHNYSFNNTLLIAMQRPDATLVAGFNAWKNKFNRYVKKGEKGIQIIAPAPIKEVEEREKIDKDTGLAVLNENGEPEMERVEYVIPRFRVTTVFDVSQTDGEPIPSLEVNELTASVKDYALLTAAIEQVSPVPMRFDEIEGDAKGYYSDADKEICIQVGMGESQTIKTMIHEVTHAMLHNSDLMKQRGEEKDRLTKETEAESIAFTVCSAAGKGQLPQARGQRSRERPQERRLHHRHGPYQRSRLRHGAILHQRGEQRLPEPQERNAVRLRLCRVRQGHSGAGRRGPHQERIHRQLRPLSGCPENARDHQEHRACPIADFSHTFSAY